MGKGKKRSRERDSDDEIMKRLRRLEKELERSKHRDQKSDRRSDPNKENTETNNQRESRPTSQKDIVDYTKIPEGQPRDGSPTFQSRPQIVTTQNPSTSRDESQSETLTILDDNDPSSRSKQLDEVTDPPPEPKQRDETTELPSESKKLDEATEILLGDDPACNDTKKVDLHQSLVTRWSVWLSEGLTKEAKDKVLEKYPRTGNLSLEAPALNAEIAPTLNDAASKRDNLFIIEQNYAGSALSALGEAVTMILKDDEEPVDRLELLERLADVGKLFSQLHYQISSARKAFIAPILSKQMRDLLQKTKPGTLLYGEKLSEVIKAAKSMEKMGNEIKGPNTPASTSSSYKKAAPKTLSGRPLNWRGPYVKQGTSHQGQRSFQPRTSYPKTNQLNNRSFQNNSFKRTKTNQYPQNNQNNSRD